MKKTKHYLIAAAGICLLPWSGMKAQERQVIDLSGEEWLLWQDKEAPWREEAICLTADEALQLPQPSPGKGWDVLTSGEALPVRVPGTAEEFLQTVSGPEGDITGVTWWTRSVNVPASARGRKVLLHIGSMRSRAEVFVNRRLAGYSIADNVPFETDITPFVEPGTCMELAVRITDAGGNHDWRDSKTIPWGEKMLPPGHGFGGITGRVTLTLCDAVRIADIYMQNTPEITTARAILTLQNESGMPAERDLRLVVRAWDDAADVLFTKEMKGLALGQGANEVTVPVEAPEARRWSVEEPNLYVCEVTLSSRGQPSDNASQRFGFRWFEASGIGDDALFRLNGRRIVLRSAISWSFWPANGLFPTDELAERQVRVAKELGLNMLHFHRFMGNAAVLDRADELGLLYFEEPGGCRPDAAQPFLNAVLHEKVTRMVKRDRSHPSLVIYNLMNEAGEAPPDRLAEEVKLLQAVHALDPSRLALRTSAWAKGDEVEDQAKIHFRPYDDTMYRTGWYDYHRAGGPAAWNEDLYKSPDDYYNRTTNRREIVFFGEEGALSSPPRLEKDKQDLDAMPHKGWDGNEYLRWYEAFDRFLDDKQLRGAYPTVDDLCVAMGAVSYEHQGRKIESARMNNLTDGYAINGWESQLVENHSGIVDCFRYPKSDPALIARYNRPLYVAVKPRRQVAAAGEEVTVDFYLINEQDVRGTYRLTYSVIGPDGKAAGAGSCDVTVSGGDVYGELLSAGATLPVPAAGGLFRIEAELRDGGQVLASGYDEVLSVNLASNLLDGKGAVWEEGTALQDFLRGRTKQATVPYADAAGKLDWVIVARPPKKEQLTMVPSAVLRTAAGEPGLDAIYYEDMDFRKEVYRETAGVVNLSAIEGATPSPFVHMLDRYGIRWSGQIIPPVSGEYAFVPQSNGRSSIEVLVDGQKVYELTARQDTVGDGRIRLEGGRATPIEVRFRHPRSNARCRLDWAVPNESLPDAQQLMRRAIDDGTKIIIVQSAEEWAEFIAANSAAVFKDKFFVGTNWLGGVMFNKPHAVFNELPAGGALNWPYQALIHTGAERVGLVMEGEELLAGAYHTYPMALGTAMGIVPMGKGKVLFSTLDIYGNIVNSTPAGLVAKKLIGNMIDF